MTANERLALVQLKIERANKHIIDLNSAVRSFLDSNPYEVRAERDPQTRKPVYYLARVDATPVCLATIAGDAIQNLRSALDHLAYQLYLVGTNDGPPSNHTYFLIERDATEYKRRLPPKVKGMRQEAIDALCAIEPYKGGKGHDFWVLHELNNIDKHRLIVTVGSSHMGVNVGSLLSALMNKGLPAGFPSIPNIDLFIAPADTQCPLKVGDKLFIGAPDGELNQKMDFRFGISVSEPSIGQSKPLLELIQQLHDLVSNTVGLFKPRLT
jgi:hypothetical protein